MYNKINILNIKDDNKEGFSILIAIFMVGFLLILVVGMLNLMFKDMKDNKGAENYIKSYAGAEGAIELGLLKIKEEGYGVDKDLSITNSGILSFNSVLQNNDPKISYKMDIGVKVFSGSLDFGKTVLIPLFSNNIGIKKPYYIGDTNIIWNIIGKGEGMSGSGNFSYNNSIYYKKNTGGYENLTIENFLNNNTGSYLMLFNKNNNQANYELEAERNFSKPIGTIVSSVQVGKFRQNITTDIDNTKFLNMLQYSLYSK